MYQLWLFLHILAAIVAFGPALASPVVGAMGGREPQHANFAIRLSHRLAGRVTVPVALTMPVTGVLVIMSANIDPSQFWLALSIVLYVVAIAFSILVQLPNVQRLVELTSGPPPAAPGPAASAPAGPPPAVRDGIRRVQLGGMLLSALIVTILALMVAKPTL